MDVILWLNSNAAAVQAITAVAVAIATGALVVGTFRYVKLTAKLVARQEADARVRWLKEAQARDEELRELLRMVADLQWQTESLLRDNPAAGDMRRWSFAAGDLRAASRSLGESLSDAAEAVGRNMEYYAQRVIERRAGEAGVDEVSAALKQLQTGLGRLHDLAVQRRAMLAQGNMVISGREPEG